MRSLIYSLTKFLSVLLLVFTVSCLRSTGGGSGNTTGSGGPLGNGEGITGRAAVVLNINNGQVRCDHSRLAARKYGVTCVAVVKKADGTEFEATEVADGHEVAWQNPPSQLSGSTASFYCSNTKLRQVCEVDLPSEDEALLKFILNIRDTIANLARAAADTVRLPYALETFGNVPQTSFYAVRNPDAAPPESVPAKNAGPSPNRPRRWAGPEGEAATPEILPPVALGIQVPVIPPEYAYLGRPYSSCSYGDKTYFSAGNRDAATFSGGHIVYVADKDGIRLFAGTYSTLPQYPVPEHRLRVSFGRNVQVICVEGGIYTVDQMDGRVLFLADSGAVKLIAGRTDGKRSTQGDPLPLYCPMFSALLPDGNLMVPDRCPHLDWQYPTFKIQTSGATVNSPTGVMTKVFNSGYPHTSFAVSPDGTYYVARGNPNGGTPPSVHKYAPGATSPTEYISSTDLANFVKANENNRTYTDYVLAVDAAGSLYLAGAEGWRIYKKTGTEPLAVWAGAARPPGYQMLCANEVTEGEAKADAVFAGITSLSFRADGALDLSDARQCKVRRIATDGTVRTVVRMKSVYQNVGLVGKKLEEAVFPRINSMAMTPNGKIYFTEPYSAKIHVIDADGRTLSSIDPPDSSFRSTADSWKIPVALAAGLNNELYFLTRTAAGSRQLRRLDTDGTYAILGTLTGTLADDYTSLSVGLDGTLFLNMRVSYADIMNTHSAIYRWNFAESYPEEIFFVPINNVDLFTMSVTSLLNGSIFYTSSMTHTVFQVNDASTATRIAGQLGSWQTASGSVGDGGDALLAKMSTPLGITADKTGMLYVADSENGRIRTLTAKNTGGYEINTLFGGDSSVNCSGNVSVQSGLTGGETSIQQALSRLCYYKMQDIAVQNTCDKPNGDVKIAFTQRYYELGSIVRIVRPCPDL